MESFPKIGNTAGGQCGRREDEFNFGHVTEVFMEHSSWDSVRQLDVGLELGKEI